MGLIESFEFFVQFPCDFFIGHIVVVSSLNDGQAGLSINDSVTAVSAEESKVFLFSLWISGGHIRIVAESCLK